MGRELAMAIGLDTARSTRAGRGGAGADRATIREVRLIGTDQRSRGEAWTAGRDVTWLGRGYRVVATKAALPPPVEEGPCPGSARRYIHLAPRDRHD